RLNRQPGDAAVVRAAWLRFPESLSSRSSSGTAVLIWRPTVTRAAVASSRGLCVRTRRGSSSPIQSSGRPYIQGQPPTNGGHYDWAVRAVAADPPVIRDRLRRQLRYPHGVALAQERLPQS